MKAGGNYRMDKVTNYDHILKSLVLKYAELKPNYSTNEWQPICDAERGEYLLVKFVASKDGLSRNKYSIFHLRLKNGKIQIEENNTDSDIVGELLEMGIRKQDLILEENSSSQLERNDLALA
jgi:XisI protein